VGVDGLVSMSRIARACGLAAGASLLVAGLTGGARVSAESPFSAYDGRLAKALFRTDRVGDALAAVAASAPAAAKPLLSAAADRARQPEPALADPAGPPKPIEMARLARRRVLAQSMVALVGTPAARAESVAASDALVRMSAEPVESALAIEIPLGDAQLAEGYLKEHRDSALTPWFYVYLMTQYRLAFERQTAAQALAGQKTSAKKYRAFLLRAKESTDPLVKAAADDVDAQLWLERQTLAHPRDFDPDACCRDK
jgi:hypothetical protein